MKRKTLSSGIEIFDYRKLGGTIEVINPDEIKYGWLFYSSGSVVSPSGFYIRLKTDNLKKRDIDPFLKDMLILKEALSEATMWAETKSI